VDSNPEVNIGLILGPFGVKGELKVMPLIDDPNRLADIKAILVGKENEDSIPYEVNKIRIHKTLVILKLKDVNTREDSMNLKHFYLRIKREELKELGEDQYYIIDLEGIEVFTEDGTRLGVLDEVITTPANDIYSIKGETRKYLIPAIKDIITKVDLENKKMLIKPIDGLLDLEG
jgi:16S rRNA processing protein RimM